jgi:coatomer subunit epsilon
LKKVDPKHQLLVDLEEKSELFDQAATKYKAKVAA